MKLDNKAKTGLLQALKISSRKWPHVTTDFVIGLPESDGFTAIGIFVDKLTQMVYLSGCQKEVTTMEYAKLFVDYVFWLHSLLEVNVSD